MESLISVVSFDLEGTLIKLGFSDKVWNVGVPRLYSEERGLRFEEAKRYVLGEYEKFGEDSVEWYDIKFWFKYLKLKGDFRRLMEAYVHELEVYPDVPEVLRNLKCEKHLILSTNSSREFVEFELQVLGNPFERIFSATSDFDLVKKTTRFYKIICNEMDVEPDEVAHVGDHFIYDFSTPRSLGIRAFHLDRSERRSGEWILRDLWEFKSKIEEMDRAY